MIGGPRPARYHRDGDGAASHRVGEGEGELPGRRRPAPHRRLGPDLRLRRRHPHPHPRQGPCAHRPLGALVRRAGDAAPSARHRRGRHRGAHRRRTARAAGPVDDRPPCRGGPDGVRGARLPVRVVVGGVRRRWRALPPSTSRRGWPWPTGSTNRSSPRPPRPRRDTTRTSPRPGPGTWWATTATRSSGGGASTSTCAAPSLAAAAGILLADTKFEFGLADGELLLIDEVLTPDSSRYWPADRWAPGATMPSFDKQPVRDWLAASGWDKTPPAPELPGEVVADTRRRYVEAYQRLTGRSFADYLAWP